MQCIHCGNKTKVMQTFAYETGEGPRVQRRRKCTDCGKIMETVEVVKVKVMERRQ